MNGIHRAGQKVVCVREFEITDALGKLYTGPEPLLDQVYTVAGFVDNQGFANPVAELTGEDVRYGIELMEVPSPINRNKTHRLGWPIIGFRPAETREHFVEVTDMLKAFTPAPSVPEREKAPIREPALEAWPWL